ncbi:hypothetical protein Sru01_55470 [Sphaerisporangium rufum]|uniref:Bacterial bifunctional deaminase-reductase C-terminal domain-containing protein n=1 Tax=Sphaerisporangium rufum TaxID=1381558 RepID=A0A919V7N5_9ACTN|nr:pyrimidine reductase family protein [Sphaerisporangium rufum]GII80565.1 hypothetical protein Sru01_55470 [Sphaerisporangium rufum]
MRRILPEPAGEADLAAAYAYPPAPWLRLNMVAGADGGAWLAGVSEGLSGKADRRVFGVLRGLADVIVAGASTVRGEGYGPVRPRRSWAALREGRPPTPPIAVVTGRLDLDLAGPLFTDPEPGVRPIVITTEAAPAERRAAAARHADVVVAGERRADPAVALAALHERGLTRVLCEGGPHLNGELLAAGLVDELCLTISPLLTGGDAARIVAGPDAPTPMRLSHVLAEDGFLFCKYTREAP